jgi:hypothetical protein
VRHPRLVRRMISLWCCLIVFVLTNVPFPVPSTVGLLSPDGPYPCQGHGCGCSTALQCWTVCCCYGPEERQEWAKKRQVRPPEYAVVASKESCETSSRAGCSKKSATASASVECHSTKGGRGDHAKLGCCTPTAKRVKSEASKRRILSMQACGCRGGSSLMTTLPWSDEPPCWVEICFEVPSRWIGDFLSMTWKGESLAPDVPPPRMVLRAV